MAAVTVFVDDAVLGRFPNVCAYDGESASWRVPVASQVGGMNPAWLLLLLLGPIGWVVLLFMAFGGNETLSCLVPVCAETTERWKERRRDRRIAGGLLALGLLLLVGHIGPTDLAVVAVFGLAFAVTHIRATLGGIGVHLDASRRWVTFTGVHETFADAVRRQLAYDGR